MNQALAALLKGNNTTISIAHRLSTIKRSDSVIVLSPDGRVAQQGSYTKLSQDPTGAFAKLMEWQMNGGETTDAQSDSSVHESEGKASGFEDADDIMEAMAEGGRNGGVGEEASSTAKSLDGAVPETVELKAGKDQK